MSSEVASRVTELKAGVENHPVSDKPEKQIKSSQPDSPASSGCVKHESQKQKSLVAVWRRR